MKASAWTGRRGASLVVAALAAAAAWVQPASTAENASGVYPLGLRSQLSGIIPAPGLYFQNDLFYYKGGAEATRAIPLHGDLVADVRATSWVNLATFLWSTPIEIGGGNLALSATLPVGGPDIRAGLGLLSADMNSAFARNAHASSATVGDPFLVGAIGWHAGNLHWTAGVGVNVPVGDYHEHALANIAFHHWAADLYGSATWLDKGTGRELSGSLGVTFNGENTATSYTSGTELHLDFAAIQHLPGGWSVGMVGYHYNQLTGDSGAGARLGGFKGRVTALGGTLGYAFRLAGRDVATSVKVFREFDVQNRLDGTAAYFTVALPLYAQPTARQSAKPLIAK